MWACYKGRKHTGSAVGSAGFVPALAPRGGPGGLPWGVPLGGSGGLGVPWGGPGGLGGSHAVAQVAWEGPTRWPRWPGGGPTGWPRWPGGVRHARPSTSVAFRRRFLKLQTYAESSWAPPKITVEQLPPSPMEKGKSNTGEVRTRSVVHCSGS